MLPRFLPGRLEGRLRAAHHGVRAVVVPRQHRGRAHRRRDGAPAFPRQGPHRLSRRDRRGIERGRRGQRHRRHDDHDDVDRGRFPACGVRSLRRGDRRARHLRHSRGKQQHAYSPIISTRTSACTSTGCAWASWRSSLLCAIAANIALNLRFQNLAGVFPLIGAGVWVAILVSIPAAAARLGSPAGDVQGHALPALARDRGVDDAGGDAAGRVVAVALGLGFVSAVFDNIPLTALALKQGGYDWGFLAYAVGFGGSMIWFGSSAGVALRTSFRKRSRSGAWLRSGWYIAVAYVVGFFVLLAVLGWRPDLTGFDRRTRWMIKFTLAVAARGRRAWRARRTSCSTRARISADRASRPTIRSTILRVSASTTARCR